MYSDRMGTDKNHPGQNLPNMKRPSDKTPPDKNPREQLRQNLYKGVFVRDFCTKTSKNRGSEMCDVLSGGPGMCDEV